MDLRQLHLAEVCTLSGQGKVRTPMQAITACHSLSPRSPTRSTNSSPCGSPAISQCSVRLAVSRAYHVPAPADPLFWVYPVSACLFPGSTLTTCPLLSDGQPATDLLVRACQPLWPNPDDEVYQQFTSVAHTELALHLTPHGGWQCRSFPRHRVNRRSRGRCLQSFTPSRYQERMSR